MRLCLTRNVLSAHTHARVHSWTPHPFSLSHTHTPTARGAAGTHGGDGQDKADRVQALGTHVPAILSALGAIVDGHVPRGTGGPHVAQGPSTERRPEDAKHPPGCLFEVMILIR